MKNEKEKKKPIQVEQSLAGQRNVVSKKLINCPKESAQTAAKGKVSQKDAGQVRSMKMNKEKDQFLPLSSYQTSRLSQNPKHSKR